MTSTKTFANPSVLEFYKELPFNYSESVEQQAESVRVRDSVLAYPVLADLLKPKTNVVEVGCGAGWLSNSIAYHYGSNVTAIDFNPVAVERAQAVAGCHISLGTRTATTSVASSRHYETSNSQCCRVSTWRNTSCPVHQRQLRIRLLGRSVDNYQSDASNGARHHSKHQIC